MRKSTFGKILASVAVAFSSAFVTALPAFGVAGVTAAITTPANGSAFNGTSWPGAPALTGTSSAASTYTLNPGSNHLTIKDTTASPNTYWNGSAWGTSVATVTPVTVTGTGNWTYSALTAAKLTSGHSYTVTDQVIDSKPNTFTTTATTFGYQTTAPTATISVPVQGAYYGTNWTGLSGTASASLPATVTTNALTIKDTTASPNTYWNGSAWGTSVATVNATGTTSWSYTLARSNLTVNHVYSVTDKVTDNAGNTATTSANTFTYQPVNNGASISSPVNGSTWPVNHNPSQVTGGLTLLQSTCFTVTIQNTTLAQQWNGSQWVASGASTSRLYLPVWTGDGGQTGSTYFAATLPGSPSSWSYNLPTLPAGSYSFQTWGYQLPGGGCLTAATTQSNLPAMITSSNPTQSINVTLPLTSISDPVNGTVYTPTSWNGVDGTSDGGNASSSLTTLNYTIKNTTTNTFWNGSTWVGADPGNTLDLSVLWPTCTLQSDTTKLCNWTISLPSSDLVSGDSYTMSATTTDSWGNVSSPAATSSWTYDIPPTTTISYPVDGSNYGTNWSGTLSGTAASSGDATLTSDALSIYDSTSNLYWSGTGWTSSPTTIPITAGTTWSYPLGASNLTDSHHYTVTNIVTDSTGTTSNTATANFGFYSAAPTTRVVTPIDGTTYGANWPGSISGTSTWSSATTLTSNSITLYDSTTGLWWNGFEWSVFDISFPVIPGANWSFLFDSANLNSGDGYSVTSVVTDALGNVSAPSTSNFVYDTTRPDTNITNPTSGSAFNSTTWPGFFDGTSESAALTPTTLAYTVYDSTSGLYWDPVNGWVNGDPGNTYTFNPTLDCSTPVIATICNWSISFDSISLTNGHNYSFSATTTDDAGNVSSTDTSTFTYFSDPPSTNITTPVDGTTYNSNWPGTISGTSTPQDANTIASNALTIEDLNANGGAGSWWNGNSWQSTPATVTPSGTTSWSFSLPILDLCGLIPTVCPSSGDTISVTNVATDDLGQQSSPSTVEFSFNIAPPTTTITTPVDGTTYGYNFPGSVSGTSTGEDGATISSNTLTIKDTTANGGSGLWWNGSSWQDHVAELTASGTTSWSYPLSVASLCHTTAPTGCPGSGDSFTVTNLAIDSNGLHSNLASSGFTLVTAPPTIAITSYQNSTRYGQSNWPGGSSGYISGPLTAGTNLLEPSSVSIQILRKVVSYQSVTYNDYWNPIATGCDPTVGSQSNADYPTDPASCWTATPAYNPTTWSSTTSPNWGPPDQSPSLHPDLTQCLNYGTSTPRSCTWSYYFPSSYMQNGVTYTSRVIGVDTGGNAANAVKCWTYWNYGPSTTAATVTALTPSQFSFQGTAQEQVACYVACSYNSTPPPPYTWIGASITDVQVTIKDLTNNKYWNGSSWQSGAASVDAITSNAWATWSYSLTSGGNYLTSGHQYQVSSIALDSSGNQTQYPLYNSNGGVTLTQPTTTVTYSSSPPSTSVVAPSNNSTVGANYSGLSGTSTGSGSMKVTSTALTIKNMTSAQYWNGSAWQTDATTVPATVLSTSGSTPPVTTWKYYNLPPNQLTSGNSYSVSAVATDAGTNVSSASSSTFRYYTTPPTTNVTYPQNISYGANWLGTLRGTVSTASGATSVYGVALQIRDTTTSQYWNGGSWQSTQTSVQPTGTTSWSYSLPASNLTSGHIYWVIVTAVDTVGNTSTSVPHNFTYDTTAPTVVISNPVDGTTYGNNWGGAISGVATPHGSLAIVSNAVTIQDTTNNLYWNGSAWVGPVSQFSANVGNAWGAKLPASKLVSGHSYQVIDHSTDSGGNIGASSLISFSYDTRPPSVAVTYPVNGGTYGSNWWGTFDGTAAGLGGKTIVTVTVTLFDTNTGKYWSGSAWSTTTSKFPAALTTATTWGTDFSRVNFTAGHTYVVTALAVDSGNIDPPSAPVRFTYSG